METRNEIEPRRFGNRNHPGRVTGGIVLLLAGAALLVRQLGAPVPDWLFSWPVLLILIGLITGFKVRFRSPGWLIPMTIGIVFLADDLVPSINLKPFLLPIIIMIVGLLFIMRPKGGGWHRGGYGRWRERWHDDQYNQSENTGETPAADRSDFIDATAVFGGIKKMVLSKNFQGGDITNIMGGSEINLTQADFNGRILIDTTNIFGGTKLIVPPHWDVQSEVVAIFGGVDDKRQLNGVAPNPSKVVVIDGTCLFGGIEIRSY